MAEVGSGSKINFPISGTGKLVPVKDNAASAGAKQKYIDLADLQALIDGKQASLGYIPVTNARTITINGTSYDLTANRSWTVGDELISNKSDSYTVSSSTTYASTKALVDGLATKQASLGYTAENVANKSDSYTVSSSTTYASTKALVDGLATKQASLGYTAENIANKGVANGYTPLNSSAKIDSIYLPDSILGQVSYQGTWNASTNTPTIPTASTANKGYYYIVSVAGSTNIGGITDWKVGDWIISDGTAWTKVDNTDAISSFNSRTGAITLTSGDVTTALGFTPVAAATTLAGYGITDAWKQGGNALTGETILGGSSGAFGLDIRTNGLTAMKVLSSPASAVNYLTVTSAAAGSNPKFDSSNGGIDLLTTVASSQLRLFSASTNTAAIVQIWDGFAAAYKNILSTNYSGSSRLQFGAGWSALQIAGANGFSIDIAGSGCIITSSLGFNVVTQRSLMTPNADISVNSGSTEYNAHIFRVASGSLNYAPTGTNTSTVNMLKLMATFNQTVAGSGPITLIDTNSVTVTNNVGQFTVLRSNIAAATGRYGLYIDNLANYLGGNTSIGDTTNTARLTIGGATTAKASLRIMAGTAPTSPNDGDCWYDGTNIYLRVGSTTKTFTLV